MSCEGVEHSMLLSSSMESGSTLRCSAGPGDDLAVVTEQVISFPVELILLMSPSCLETVGRFPVAK